MQDILGLASEARMNTPARPVRAGCGGSEADQLDPACADRLAELTTLYGRA